MHIFNSLFSVLLLIGLGAALQKKGFFAQGFLQGLNHLVYWIGFPCLIFIKAAAAEPLIKEAGNVLTIVLGTVVIGMIFAYLVAWFLKAPKGSVGTFVQACFRGNPAYVGLPILIFAFGRNGAEGQALITVAILTLAAMIPFTTFFAVIVLVADNHRPGVKKDLWSTTTQVVTNPFILSSLLGLVFNFFKIPIPYFIELPFDLVGQTALPLALMTIGAALVITKIDKKNLRLTVAASLVRVIFMPVVTYFLILGLEASSAEAKIALVFAACPTATVSYVMAAKLGGNEELAASTVVLSTILSFFSLSAALFMTA